MLQRIETLFSHTSTTELVLSGGMHLVLPHNRQSIITHNGHGDPPLSIPTLSTEQFEDAWWIPANAASWFTELDGTVAVINPGLTAFPEEFYQTTHRKPIIIDTTATAYDTLTLLLADASKKTSGATAKWIYELQKRINSYTNSAMMEKYMMSVEEALQYVRGRALAVLDCREHSTDNTLLMQMLAIQNPDLIWSKGGLTPKVNQKNNLANQG